MKLQQLPRQSPRRVSTDANTLDHASLLPSQYALRHAGHAPQGDGVDRVHAFANHDGTRNLVARQGPHGSPRTLQNKPGQLLSSKPIAVLAAGLARPDQLGMGIRAQDADRGVQVYQVRAELVAAGGQSFGLTGQLGTLADQGG